MEGWNTFSIFINDSSFWCFTQIPKPLAFQDMSFILLCTKEAALTEKAKFVCLFVVAAFISQFIHKSPKAARFDWDNN